MDVESSRTGRGIAVLFHNSGKIPWNSNSHTMQIWQFHLCTTKTYSLWGTKASFIVVAFWHFLRSGKVDVP